MLSKEDINEAVGVFIQSSVEDLDDKNVETICGQLAALLDDG